MNSIRRNKIIIATAAITLVAVIFCWILTHSSFNGTFSFHCVHNQNTGEPLSIWTSIMLYILLFLFFRYGAIGSSYAVCRVNICVLTYKG